MLYRDAFPILNGIYVMPFFSGFLSICTNPKKEFNGGNFGSVFCLDTKNCELMSRSEGYSSRTSLKKKVFI
jgi:hypothetical protein